MKHLAEFVIILCITVLVGYSFAESERVITPPEAGRFAGKWVTICGKIGCVQYIPRWMGQPTYIAFDHPNPGVSAVVMGEDSAKFGVPLDQLFEGKEVCVSGLVNRVKNRYEIKVREPFQIQVNK